LFSTGDLTIQLIHPWYTNQVDRKEPASVVSYGSTDGTCRSNSCTRSWTILDPKNYSRIM